MRFPPVSGIPVGPWQAQYLLQCSHLPHATATRSSQTVPPPATVAGLLGPAVGRVAWCPAECSIASAAPGPPGTQLGPSQGL